MGIPNNKWSCIKTRQPDLVFTLDKPSLRYSAVFDIKPGPAALSDSQGKLNNRFWMVYQDGTTVKLVGATGPDTWSAPVNIFTEANAITRIALTFDQLGREIIFYKTLDGLILWAYDSLVNDFVKKTIAVDGDYPLANFDLISRTSEPISDAMIFYVKNDGIYWRLQRDRFNIEYFSYEEKEDIEIYFAAIARTNRFKVDYKYTNFKDRRELPKAYETDSAVFTSLNNDEIELGFTLGFGEYRECVFEKGITAFGLIEQTDWNASFGVNLKIRTGYLFGGEFPQIYIEGRSPGVILATLQMNDHFVRGEYRFVFTNEPASIKRVSLYIKGVLIDSKTFNKGSEEPVSVNTKLKFGSLDEHTATSRLYWRSFPAQFFNMYAIVNTVRIDWPVTEGVQGAVSVPAGNNLNLIKPSKTIRFLS